MTNIKEMTKTVSEMTVAEKFHFYKRWDIGLWLMLRNDEISEEEYLEESEYCATAAIQNGVYMVNCNMIEELLWI